jgi:hypothetical protein
MAVETTEKKLLGLERAFWDALKRKDAKAATRLTDFPCIVTGPQGVASLDEQTLRPLAQHDQRQELGRQPMLQLAGTVSNLAIRSPSSSSIRTERVVDDVTPASVSLTADHFGAAMKHLHRPCRQARRL